MGRLTEILLDTSSLSEALACRGTASELGRAVIRRDVRLLISTLGLQERFASGSERWLLSATAELLRLWDYVGKKQLDVARPLDEIYWMEAATSVPLSATPKSPRAWRDYLAMAVAAGHFDPDFLREAREAVERYKDDMAVADAQCRQDSAALLGNRKSLMEVLSFLDNYTPDVVPDWIIQGMFKRIGRSPTEAELLAGNPARYLSIRAGSALAHFTMHAAVIPSDTRGSLGPFAHLAPALKPGRGDWYDASIAAEAAYCSHLIVEDRSLRARCNHLRARGCLRFESVSLEEFI